MEKLRSFFGISLVFLGFLAIWAAVGYSDLEPTATISGTLLKAGGGFLFIGIGILLAKREVRKWLSKN